MADPLAPDNPLTKLFDAGAGKIGTVVDQARQRVRERAREAARRQTGVLAPPARSGSSGLPQVAALPVPEQAKDGSVAIRLPNGRRLKAVLSPGMARRSDVAAIARASADNNRRAFAALQAQGAAIDSLKRTQEQLAAQISQLEKRADDAVLALNDTFSQSTRQLKRVAAQGQKALARAGTTAATAVRQLQQIQTLAATQQAQNLTSVIGTAQATAYGERGSVLAPNNLLLTGNQLLWTLLGPASTALGASADTVRLLGLLAPLGSLLTGYAAVGSRVPENEEKPERFISGLAVFDMSKDEYTESLRSRISNDLWEEFRKRNDVPVTANSIDDIAPAQVSAAVINGELNIKIGLWFSGRIGSLPKGRFRIAWMIDTGASSG
jgi:hypothetical protein